MEYAKKGEEAWLSLTVLLLSKRCAFFHVSKTHLFDLSKADELKVVNLF